MQPGLDAGSRDAAPAAADAATDASPAPRSLDQSAVDKLVADAKDRDSAELVILKDGKLIGDWRFSKSRAPIQTMSITKSVLALAIGCLVDAGKLHVDEPVYRFFPRWKSKPYRNVTLYDLMTHSSGLEWARNTLPIYRSKNFVEMTLASKLVHKPGTYYHYSNRGANLVSGIVGKASGMRTDRYVNQVIFRPLGITHWWWQKDHAGQPQGMAGLHLEPRDLAKIGELVRLEGEYDGKRVVSAKWIRRATAEPAKVQPTSRRLGLLWWLVPAWTRITITKHVLDGWQKAGVDAAFIDRARPLLGKTFHSTHAFLDALREAYEDPHLERFRKTIWQHDLPDAKFDLGPTVGSYSEGTLGQFVVILPRDGLVAVRMRREPKRRRDRHDPRLDFVDFVERVQGLVH